jgi:hypothetical protein
MNLLYCTKKIPKGQSDTVYRRTDNIMAKRKRTKGQTTQWPKEKDKRTNFALFL